MEYTGLYLKYPVNRPLTQQERECQLRQKDRLELEPADQLSVIKSNSSYLELVDKYFAWKGFISGALIFGILGAAALLIYVVCDFFTEKVGSNIEGEAVLGLVALAVIYIPFMLVFAWLLCKESFAYTHYPIRFNRKTRMVHVFRVDGSVLSVSWDSVFFCLGSLRQGNWEVQGHILAEDGETVKETFCAFPQIAGNTAEREQLKLHWEFMRRYMEDGPQDAYQRAKICLPIADQRERVSFGFHRMHAEGTGNLVTQLLAAGLGIAILPGRWFAMRTSKIPKWPPGIEAVNPIDPGDRFVRDASMNEKWKELPDGVWGAISALFWAVIIYWASGLQPWH